MLAFHFSDDQENDSPSGSTGTVAKNRSVTRRHLLDMTMIGLCAALIAACSALAIPMPWGVPVTMQTFAVMATVGLLGTRRGTAAIAVWIALGAIGVPVFANFNSGIAYLLGTTGGYILGFLLCAPIEGFIIKLGKGKLPFLILGMVAGMVVCYTFGTAWFMVVYAQRTGPVALATVLGWCVTPYLVPEVFKIALAVAISMTGRKLKWVK